jgi:hypothetical protein
MSISLGSTVDKLCAASVAEYYNPFEKTEWPDEISADSWCTSPELLTLYGSAHYDMLDERARRHLSLLEAVNFYSLNIHGEKALIEGLARRLYRKNSQEISPYLHHFLDEENKHMVYFGRFCTKYGGKIYPDRKLSFPREYAAGEEDFLFFVKVMIFEEIVDVYNIRMSLDQRLHPLAREINRMHHKDEARHLVFGRQVVQELFQQHQHSWSADTLQSIRAYVADYFKATWLEYYNAEVYRDFGMANAIALQAEVWHSPQALEHRQEISKGCISFLLTNEVLLEEPEL